MLFGIESIGRYWFRPLSILFLLFLLSIDTSHADKRVALVIGNRNYIQAPAIDTAINDARAIAHKLRRLNFDVIEAFDVDNSGMEAGIRSFSSLLKQADIGLFFYSGRGMQVGGKNYLVPIDARIGDASDLHFETIDLQSLIALMEQKAKSRLLFIDASHAAYFNKIIEKNSGENPVSVGKGLAPVSSEVGTSVAFSSEPGMVNAPNRAANSIFTQGVLRNIDIPGLEITDLLTNIRNTVRRLTNNQQTPWFTKTITGNLVIVPARSTEPSIDATLLSKKQLKIKKLMVICDAHYAAFRLTDPVDRNALSCFRSILKIDEANAEALDGIRAIETNYINWAEAALDAEDEDKIAQYLTKLHQLNTGQARTQEIIARVEQREAEKQARLAAIEARKQEEERKRREIELEAENAKQLAMEAKKQLQLERQRKERAEEERKVAEQEAMEAALLAKQKRAELEELKKTEKLARKKAEEEKRQAELARQKAEEDARMAEIKRLELQALLAAEASARKKAEEDERLAEEKRNELAALQEAEKIARKRSETETRLAEEKHAELEALRAAEKIARQKVAAENQAAEKLKRERLEAKRKEETEKRQAKKEQLQADLEKQRSDEEKQQVLVDARVEEAKKILEQEDMQRRLEAENIRRQEESQRLEVERQRIEAERQRAEADLAERLAEEEAERQAVKRAELERQRKVSVDAAREQGDIEFDKILRRKEIPLAKQRLEKALAQHQGIVTADQAKVIFAEIITEFKAERARLRREKREKAIQNSKDRG